MLALRLRRRRVNYVLPSEGVDILTRLIGKSLLKFDLGTRNLSKEDHFEENSVRDFSDLIYKPQGGPFLISCESGKTVILYDDDFLGSIVLREIERDVDDADFFACLELQDKIGERTSPRAAINLFEGCDWSGKIIIGVSLYKLPVNFIRNPNQYDLLNECVLCLRLQDIGDVLFVCEIRDGGGAPDIRVSSWTKLDKGLAKHLTCSWSSGDNDFVDRKEC